MDGNNLFNRFNRGFHKATLRYQNIVTNMLSRTGRYMLIYVGLAALMGILFLRLPTAFLPPEDQGRLILLVQTPTNATQQRTNKVLEQIQEYFLEKESKAVKLVFTVQGWSYSGSGQNVGLGFVLLRDWAERSDPSLSPAAIAQRAWSGLSFIKDAQVTMASMAMMR